MTKKKPQLVPASDMTSQATQRFNLNRESMNPRQFEDAARKVTGGIRGVPSQSLQWNRWAP
jgi:hypothetical protein